MRVTGDSRYGDSMERVLYNTILGATPLKEDGSSFYYSDYNNQFAKKGYHRDKWPCCSGTFPQITADYGISSYFYDAEGIYVNLYVPSRVTWMQGGARVSLTQKTNYPYHPSTQIEVSVDESSSFPVFLRIPAWAGPGTAVAVNGKRVLAGPKPGEFARVDGNWKNGDRIEVEFDMPNALEAVDPQHPDVMALVHGPLALFSVGAIPASIGKRDLLTASQIAAGSTDWQTNTAAGTVTMRPFAAIQDEIYRLYHKVEG
jgi:DUF1680 family protein